MTKATPSKTVFLAVCGAALIAISLGVVQLLHGPEAQHVPNLQTKLITMQSGQKLIVQTREVTRAEWQACHQAGHCTLEISTSDNDIDYPATGLSFIDAMEYVAWINTFSDTNWRLPTAVEWQELAVDVMPETPDPVFTDPSLTWASTYLTQTNSTGRALRPSGAFSTTPGGIEDLDGNVWEWTQDCYAGASGQGEALSLDQCPAFIMGGEHEAVMSYLVRDPARGGCAVGTPPALWE